MLESPDFTTIDSEKVKAIVVQLNEKLATKGKIDKKIKAKPKYITKAYPESIAKYEQQEAMLMERNSYCKTDPDATC